MLSYIKTVYPEVLSRPDMWSGYLKDFHSDEELTEFVVTPTGSGAAGITVSDAVYGIAAISGQATTDKTGAQMQYDGESVALVTGKTTLFGTSASLSEVTQSWYLSGLCITDTALRNTSTGAIDFSDGVYFAKSDGDASIGCYVIRDSAVINSATAVKTLVADTTYDLEIKVLMSSVAGTGTAYFYVNGAEVARLASSTMPYSGEEILTSSVHFFSGSATGTMTCLVDYVAAFTER